MQLNTDRIETKRLVLRPFIIEDAEDMFRNYCSEPLVTKYLTWSAYKNVQDACDRIAFLQTKYKETGWADWAIVLKDLGQVIGSIGVVRTDDRVDGVEIGYCIGSRWWHRGIMSEAFSAVIDHLFSTCGVNRIAAGHDPNNPHSGDVMKKCGLMYEGTARQADRNNQGICDAVHYAILKEDWQKGI